MYGCLSYAKLPYGVAGKTEGAKIRARDKQVRDEDTAAKEQAGKAAPAGAPAPDVGGATGLGTQLSSVAGPALQVRAILVNVILHDRMGREHPSCKPGGGHCVDISARSHDITCNSVAERDACPVEIGRRARDFAFVAG